jgi:hypothetical protein
MNYCFGVQSKNSVDVLIDFSINNPDLNITFIPSRRQLDYSYGYVNHWTTQTFTEYVKSKNPNIKIERDHGGPGQGYEIDDGYISLSHDCDYFSMIHIDPWKKYPDFLDGCKWTADMIKFCYKKNPLIEFEIATEEAIRPFTVEELEELILYLKNDLSYIIFNQIKCLVIQSGTRLCEGKNIGVFDELKLKNMLSLASKYNLIAKEHNGDWSSMDNINKKTEIGLKLTNIAPELGMIETDVILEHIKKDTDSFEKVYDICYKSNLWKKWVSNDFDYINSKEYIIRVSCHYHYTNDEIIKIKNKIHNIDYEIKQKLCWRLNELYHKLE